MKKPEWKKEGNWEVHRGHLSTEELLKKVFGSKEKPKPPADPNPKSKNSPHGSV